MSAQMIGRGAWLSLAMLLCLGSVVSADDLGDRLRETLKDEHAEGTDLWIYNNLERAKEQAKRENKPIFVTFRCVPCKSCSAFDATVAKGSEVIENLARKEFISIRQVEMKGVDLTQFEFDYDLNWAAMFINADGTVYARYGTQSAEGPDAYNSVAGLQTTMRRVLELHENYPANKAELQGKKGKQKPYKTAMEMPGLKHKEERKKATTRRNCIHCHNIHDAINEHAQETGTFTKELLYRFPLPDNLGLSINARDGRLVKAVESGSPAQVAGLQAGEEITHMNGQVITSIADMQWVLHNLPNTDTQVKVTGSRTGEHTLALEAGWKKSDFSWRGSLWSVQPKLRVWSPAMSEEDRRKRGLPTDQGALQVKYIGANWPAGRAAREAGLRTKDIIVELDGKPLGSWDHKAFNIHVKMNYKVGEKLPITVLRGNRKLKMEIKLVE